MANDEPQPDPVRAERRRSRAGSDEPAPGELLFMGGAEGGARSEPGHVSVLPALATPRDAHRSRSRPTVRLPFDVYQRYRLVADLVERLADGKTLSVLDVGGATGVLLSFLPDHRITLVDVQDSDQPGFVYGDGSRLPFRDGAFDVVVTCDTLEHLPESARRAFLEQCARCARRGVVIAGPYRAERVEEAEETLRAFLREKLGREHRYLEEHRAYGLPVRAQVEALFERRGLVVTSIGHGNLERWLALLCLSMYMDRDPHLRRIAEDVYAFYNQALYASDVNEPVYRHAVVAVVPGVHLPTAEELFAPARSAGASPGRPAGQSPGRPGAAAPEGSLEPFVHLAAELIAFDRERDVYEAERARLTAVVDGLVLDLDGHKARLATLEADLAGHRASLATSAADLAGHKELVLHLQRESDERLEALTATELDLEGHRRTLEALAREGAERARHATALERELARVGAEAGREREGHVQERSELMLVLADRERSLEEHRAFAATLRAELATRREYDAGLERELGEVNALAARLNAELVDEREENRALRDELASRWRSLKRALRKRAG